MVSSEAPEVLLKPGDHIAITCSREHYDEILSSVSIDMHLCSACIHVFVCVYVCIY